MNTTEQVKPKKPRSEKTTKKSLDTDEDSTYYVTHADEQDLIMQFQHENRFETYNPFDY